MPAPAVSVSRVGPGETVVSQGALAPHAPRLFALVMAPTVAISVALFLVFPPVLAAGVVAGLAAVDALAIVVVARLFASTLAITVAPGRVTIASGPLPRRVRAHDPARWQRLTLTTGVRLKWGRTVTERVAIRAVDAGGAAHPLCVVTGGAAARDVARHLVEAIASHGGPAVAVP